MVCLHGHRSGACRICHPASPELRAEVAKMLVAYAVEEELQREKIVPDGVGEGFVVFKMASDPSFDSKFAGEIRYVPIFGTGPQKIH